MKEIKLDTIRRKILETKHHILVEGGPGSGKTTIALMKAKQIVESGLLMRNQKILFLSFARATISRIEEHAKHLISYEVKSHLEINTYHGFAWQVIQSYGSLLHGHKSINLITPPNLAARLATVDQSLRNSSKETLLADEGLLCFDLFCKTVAEIFTKSARIAKIISVAYPVIIVDEFQDTDQHEWELIKHIGYNSSVLALADLEQRIYEFRGASITRIPEFVAHFNCEKFTLGKDNNRSPGTDIVKFGDDLLTGMHKDNDYENVRVVKYKYLREIKDHLRYEVLNSIKRLTKSNKNGEWALAILVKAKATTLTVSSFLTNKNIYHEVLIDPTGLALSASVIAFLLEPPTEEYFGLVAKPLINHVKGRKGDKPSQSDLGNAAFIEKVIDGAIPKGTKQKKLIEEINQLIVERKQMVLTGVPETDWLNIRSLFEGCTSDCLKNVYEDAKYLKLLHKGATLSESLNELWRLNGTYKGANLAVENALTQEHFSMVSRLWKGVYIMNIHKCKGKEFDEVIIWEEPYKQIVFEDSKLQDILALRVAITRAKSRATFLTPDWSPSIVL